jgi:hypothetical protein
MAGDYLLTLDPVNGESSAQTRYPSLGLLMADLHCRSGGYILTSVAHGARSDAQLQTLAALRRLGVMAGSAAGDGAVGTSAPSFIVVEVEGGAANTPRPAPLLLVISDRQDAMHLLLPAVQKVREAACRMKLPAACRIAIGPGVPGASAGPSKDRHEKWTELSSFSN